MIRPLVEDDLTRIKEIDRAAFSADEQCEDAVYGQMPRMHLVLSDVDA